MTSSVPFIALDRIAEIYEAHAKQMREIETATIKAFYGGNPCWMFHEDGEMKMVAIDPNAFWVIGE